MTTNRNKTTQKKVNKLISLSCDAMCSESVWTTTNHRALVDALDALSDEVRAVNKSLCRIAGMASADLFLESSTYAERLREERKELGRHRKEAISRQQVISEIQYELRLANE